MKRLGWLLLGVFGLFMLGASVFPKLTGMPVVGDTMDLIGWPHKFILLIGMLELIATLLVLWPRTALAGGLMMTAILGGAIASQLRVEAPLFSHTLFGVYLGVVMWLGILLRDQRILSVLINRKM